MFHKVQLGFIVFVLAGLVALRAEQPAPAAAAGPATMQPGQIHAVRIRGDVTKAFNDGRIALKEGDSVEEKATVTTGQNGTVVLVFSNGATTQLGPDTVLSIEQYLQDPFKEAEVKIAELTEEPTRSNTRLRLTKGELVGKVVHLHHDQGSTFEVQTPVGAAGIRGTTFRIVFRPTGTGQAFNFQLSTVEGNVNFQQSGTTGPGGGANAGQGQGQGQGQNQNQSQNQNQNQPAQGGTGNQGANTGSAPTPPSSGGTTGSGLAVGGGQEIVVIVPATVSATGAVTFTAAPVISSVAPISTATQTQITAAAQQIVTAAATVVFQAPATTTSGTTQTSGTSGTGNQQQQPDSSQQNQNQQNQNQQQGSGASNSSNTTGNTGNSNTTGNTGNTGNTGSTGNTGTTGNTGSTSNTGNTGNTNRPPTTTNPASNLVTSPPPPTPTPRVTTGDGRPGT